MRKWIFFVVLLFCSLLYIPASRAATTPPAAGASVLQTVLEKIASYKLKDLQKLAGRKFTFKEKVSFWLLKGQIKNSGTTSFSKNLAGKLLSKSTARKTKPSKKEEAGSLGHTAFIFGLVAAGLLVAGLFLPYVIIGSLVSAILAIVLGTLGSKKDPSDAKARVGKLLGWITLGLIVILFTIVILAFASIFD